MVGGQLQALVVPCKLVQLFAQEKQHPATVVSSTRVEQAVLVFFLFVHNVGRDGVDCVDNSFSAINNSTTSSISQGNCCAA